MEKISRISNKQYRNYNLETLLTPLKLKQNKFKENFMNSFLQDSNQAQNKTRPNIPPTQKTKCSISDTRNFNHFIDRNKKYNINNKKNKNQRYVNNFIPLSPLSGDKTKQRNNDKNKKYTILNPFKERSSSSTKSILVPSNENQISIVNLETINKNRSNNVSYINDLSDKKLKRNNTVYIKKHFSKDKKVVNKYISGNYYNKSGINLNNKNWNKDDYRSKPKRKNILRYNSSNTMRKQSKTNPTQENNTNNINSNVNIFNFDMQYNNSPNYIIKNSKMYNPCFNNYLPSTLNNNNEINNLQNLITIRNKKYKNAFNENYNDTIIKLDHEEEEEEEKIEKQLFHQSAIMIQSAFRGCIIRAQINNMLKAYKGIEYLDYFFRMKFWKYFRNLLIYMKSNIINNDMDSKMSISSISCISALFNTNKNFSAKSFNSKQLHQEIRESFCIINHNNNNNNNNNNNDKYLDTFKNINMNDNKKNKVLIWNKKKIYKNNTSSNIINQKVNNNKEKCLKMIVIKNINRSRLLLLKYFMKFYFNGILNKNEKQNGKKVDDYSNKDIDKLKNEKLKNIIEKKERKPKLILYNFFFKFYFRGILKLMENNSYCLANGGRLHDISFIYSKNSNIKEKNLKLTLKKIIILKKIILKPRKLGKEAIRKYFYKFHLYGIISFMKKELNKRIISKKLSILEEEKKINKDGNDKEMKNLRIKILKRAIYNKDRIHKSICKNVFDKWDLKTRIFSIIAIDKEKKKKRRIKKRNNKKLGSNSNNNQNNNSNSILVNNNKNNISQKISNIFVNSNSKKNINQDKKGINQNNFIVEHRESVIFSNKIKINDYFKIDKFIRKVYSILTYKFHFFSLIKSKYQKKNGENNDDKLKNDDIDFFIEDSDEQSED